MKILLVILTMQIPLISLGQLNISNNIDLIRKYKVKDVLIYKTKLNDISKEKIELLNLIMSYDSLGRRSKTQDYYKGQYMGKWNYYYADSSLHCIKTNYVSKDEKIINEDKPGINEVFNVQDEDYTNSSKNIISLNNEGLYSIIIIYSKIVYKNGEIEANAMYTEDQIDPQEILRFEYTYY